MTELSVGGRRAPAERTESACAAHPPGGSTQPEPASCAPNRRTALRALPPPMGARRSGSGLLEVVAAAAVGAILLLDGGAGARAEDPGDIDGLVGGAVAVAPQVEPEVREAFLRALRAIPEEHRSLLQDLALRRAPAPELPPEAPLVYRIWAAATLAMYRSGPHEIVVFDEAARGHVAWSTPAARPDLYALVIALGDALRAPAPAGPDDPALEASWAELAGKIHRLAGRAPPDATPPLGDPAALDLLVVHGRRFMLGGEPELWQLLVHEIGHAVQLGKGDIEGWASLSGWWDADDGPADGFVWGSFSNELPIVAMRIALGADRGPLARYRPAADARFPTPYASFDPIEDFAECYRFLATDPLALAGSAPEKFLAVDALGWCRDGGGEPGPLRLPVAKLMAAPWREPVLAGAKRLIGAEADRPGPLTRVVVALLRAHASVLVDSAAELAMHAPPAWPEDLPPEVAAWVARDSFEARVGDRILRPAPERVLEVIEAALRTRTDEIELERGLDDLRDAPTEKDGEAIRRQEKPSQRSRSYRALIRHGGAAGAWDLFFPGALATVGAEPHAVVRAMALFDLARAACAANRPQHALAAAAAIDRPFVFGEECRLMAELAAEDCLRRLGDPVRARELRVRIAASVAAARSTTVRANALVELAEHALAAGEPEAAAGHARTVPRPALRARALAMVGRAFARSGRTGEAEAAFGEADKVGEVRDEVALARAEAGLPGSARERALAALVDARGAAALLEHSDARNRIAGALRLIQALPHGAERESALAAAALATLECGCRDELARTAQALLDTETFATYLLGIGAPREQDGEPATEAGAKSSPGTEDRR